jgi:nucleotide-binding universal stress UspA family protein
MSYKTILVHADKSSHAPARIRLAASLALAEDAHLVGAAMTGLSRFVSPAQLSEVEHSVLAAQADAWRDRAHGALAQFEALAAAAKLASHEARVVADDPEGGLVALSCFCDLLVLGQTDPAETVAGAVRDLPEFVMLSVARPVLLVPYAGVHERLDGAALVAWDGSLEASRALANAVPLLRRASAVIIAQFDAGDGALARADSDLLQWLGRHGVKANVRTHPASVDIGEALLSMAADLNASLLVMGGYGHTRFRELMLGGVTRTILERMTAPVLMSH